jgi:hypothetical protein
MSTGNAVIGSLRAVLGLDTAEFETGLKQVETRLGGVGKMFAALGGSAIFAGFVAGLGGAVQRLEETRKLSAQLDKALQNTGNAARTSAAEVEAFADKMERATGRAAEEVLAVSTNLATFGFGNETFFRALTLADDMAAAWGGDLKQNIEGLGRALAEPEKGLAMLVKRGITFDDQQKAQIAKFMKVNDLAGAQGVIFEALEGQVKGVAEAGFGGLTKAQANVGKAFEDIFEAMASGMQIGTGLEMVLIAAAAGLDLITANMDTIGKVATIAGVALATAMGPTIWGAMATAATVFGTAAVGAIRAVGVAIMTNPIGFIVTALAAAATAAFVFRDNIKQAIGVDVAGEIIDIGNKIMGVFVGAFEAVKSVWGELPAFFSGLGKRAWNGFLETFEHDALTLTGPGGFEWSSGIKFNLGGAKAKLTPEEEGALQTGQRSFDKAYNADYLGVFGHAMFGEGGPTSVIKGFDDIATGAETAGGRISDAMNNALEAMRLSLMTEEEAEIASHEKRLAELDRFLAAGAIKQDEYNDLVERAKAQHAERMNDIAQKQVEEESRIRSQLAGNVAGIFGSISSLLEKFGDENLVASKAFAVAGAVVNTAEGVTKALAQGGMLGFAGAAAVAASGAAQIATILSTSKGSAKRPSVSGSASAVSGPGEQARAVGAMNITLRGDSFSKQSVQELLDEIADSLADGAGGRFINVVQERSA